MGFVHEHFPAEFDKSSDIRARRVPLGDPAVGYFKVGDRDVKGRQLWKGEKGLLLPGGPLFSHDILSGLTFHSLSTDRGSQSSWTMCSDKVAATPLIKPWRLTPGQLWKSADFDYRTISSNQSLSLTVSQIDGVGPFHTLESQQNREDLTTMARSTITRLPDITDLSLTEQKSHGRKNRAELAGKTT